MAVENKKEHQSTKKYIFKRCRSCKLKVHVSAITCQCGTKVEDMTYGSNDPSDALYNLSLNSVDKCISCITVQQGNPCRYTICFGSGRGKCDLCRRFDASRFQCCQEIQQKERRLDDGNRAKESHQERQNWLIDMCQPKKPLAMTR